MIMSLPGICVTFSWVCEWFVVFNPHLSDDLFVVCCTLGEKWSSHFLFVLQLLIAYG